MCNFKYKFYQDAGHGWLAVKIKELYELNIINDISTYSYISGLTAYLEEDLDRSIFLNAYKQKHNGESPEIILGGSKRGNFVTRSPIRSYEKYSNEKALKAIRKNNNLTIKLFK